MKKIFLIILLCFVAVFAAFAIDMSPHPGDSIETVFTVQDVIVISQAISTPANVLYLEQIKINNEICVSACKAVAVSYIGYEMGTRIYNLTDRVIAVYKTEFG